MLEKLKTFVRGVIRKMFPAKSIEQVLDVKPCISSVMQERIEFWHNMYIGMAPWCKNPITSLRKEQCSRIINHSGCGMPANYSAARSAAGSSRVFLSDGDAA